MAKPPAPIPGPDHFEWAHRQQGIAWMSQNTNTLPTTPAIEAAIQDALRRGIHHLYPLQKGLPELHQLLRADLGLPGDWGLMLSHGGLEALYAMNRALFGAGDEVVCTDPSFLPIHNQLKLAGTVCVDLPIYSPPWKLTAERVAEAITPKTKGILLIDPINPLGTAYARDEVRAIAEVAKDAGVVLIHDVTYRDFSDHQTLANEFHPEGTVIVYSFSKNAGLAGMRVGALAAPKALSERIKPFTVSTLGINILAQVAAKAALETKKEWMPRVKEQSRRQPSHHRPRPRLQGAARLRPLRVRPARAAVTRPPRVHHHRPAQPQRHLPRLGARCAGAHGAGGERAGGGRGQDAAAVPDASRLTPFVGASSPRTLRRFMAHSDAARSVKP